MKKLNFNWSWGRKKDPPPESNKEIGRASCRERV